MCPRKAAVPSSEMGNQLIERSAACEQMNVTINPTDSTGSQSTSTVHHHCYLLPTLKGHQICNTSIVLWFTPLELSQSLLGGRLVQSSACVLICIRTAEGIYRHGARFTNFFDSLYSRGGFGLQELNDVKMQCPSDVLNALMNGIVQGNEDHERSTGGGKTNFTVPNAIRVSGNQFKELDFCSVYGDQRRLLLKYLKVAITHPDLYCRQQNFLLLLVCQRAVLLVIQPMDGLISAIDSHRHHLNGSFLLCGRLTELNSFVDSLIAFLFPEIYKTPLEHQQFEMSVIQFVGQLTSFDCPLDLPMNSVRKISIFPFAPGENRRSFSPLLIPRRQLGGSRLKRLFRTCSKKKIKNK
ncbi:Protein C14C11 [Aphelenchoides besseyi]|nr:Protein C14C11 [Aphelenchoides besseyi]